MTTLELILEALKVVILLELDFFFIFFSIFTPESWKRFKEERKSRKAAKQKDLKGEERDAQ